MTMSNEKHALLKSAHQFVKNIAESGHTIYDPIEVGDTDLWIPSGELELLLDTELKGFQLGSLPLRTRSKVLKQQVCHILGYPIPDSFKKTKPRFVGQNFDTYTQKANNLQIWNEEISPNRRYILLQVSKENVITKVKVVSGDMLAKLDTTGTLTQKYQASLKTEDKTSELVSSQDTTNLINCVSNRMMLFVSTSPIDAPSTGELQSINHIYEKLSQLVGITFPDAGSDQERNRGAELHLLVCKQLGYSDFRDNGRFPDIRHQLLEVKLQTSPTIDLGLIKPDSTSPLDIPQLNGIAIRPCDVRYAIFYAIIEDGHVRITHFFLATGEDFFRRFPQLQGKAVNKKLQIPLPRNFFDE